VARLDTRLEAQGAEFLVLGQLLVAGVQAYKAYTNYPGYDLVAVSKDGQRTCRIQVKSRWATDWDRGFPIKNFECDFVVLAALNRGSRYRRKGSPSDDVRPPEFWVFPVADVRAAQDPKSSWGKVFLRRFDDPDRYRDAWHLVLEHLDPGLAAPNSPE
jgi:hypothetical protein